MCEGVWVCVCVGVRVCCCLRGHPLHRAACHACRCVRVWGCVCEGVGVRVWVHVCVRGFGCKG